MKNAFKFLGYFSILLHFDAHPRAVTDLLEIVKNPCLDQVFGNDSGSLSYLEQMKNSEISCERKRIFSLFVLHAFVKIHMWSDCKSRIYESPRQMSMFTFRRCSSGLIWWPKLLLTPLWEKQYLGVKTWKQCSYRLINEAKFAIPMRIWQHFWAMCHILEVAIANIMDIHGIS